MDSIKAQMIETGRWIMERGLTWGTSGNISARTGDAIYVTASGTVLGALTEADITKVSLSGEVIEGKRPSKETGMHLEIYRNRPDVQAAVHASPFYATLASVSDLPLKTNLFIESMYYDETVAAVPYFHAGSRQLADAVAAACKQAQVILMKNHGILVCDVSLGECRNALEVSENVCRMNLYAAMGGFSLTEVPQKTVAEFLAGGYYKKRRAGR